MHIVLDMHVAQALARRNRVHSGAVSLTQALLRNGVGHRFTVVLDGHFGYEAHNLRHDLEGCPPNWRMRVWDAPGVPAGKRLTDTTTRIIRETFIEEMTPDLVLGIPDFEPRSDLRSQIATVLASFPTLTSEVGQISLGQVAANTAWDRIAAAIVAAAERMPRRAGPLSPHTSSAELLQALANEGPREPGRLAALAQCLAQTFPEKGRKRSLFVDVTQLIAEDSGTGCQRVTRGVLTELLGNPPAGFDVLPVEAFRGELGYRYSRGFTQKLQGDNIDGAAEDRIEVCAGDIFFGLDFQAVTTVEQFDYLQNIRLRGAKLFFFLHDLLPLERPEAFLAKNEVSFRRWLKVISKFDGIIANSRATLDSYIKWSDVNLRSTNRGLKLDWVHLGSDIETSMPSMGLPSEAALVLEQIASKPSFLMVGTLEPRKGHHQVLDGFDELWDRGEDINLVIVGRQGWKVDGLVSRLRSHPQRGVRLFWLDGISDEYLAKVYASCVCLVAASEAEGFGLPIVEAARKGLPLIARDIPVFVELAGEHAHYFSGMESKSFSIAVEEWLRLYANGEHPSSSGIRWLTWKETTLRIVAILTRNADTDEGTVAPPREDTLSMTERGQTDQTVLPIDLARA